MSFSNLTLWSWPLFGCDHSDDNSSYTFLLISPLMNVCKLLYTYLIILKVILNGAAYKKNQ